MCFFFRFCSSACSGNCFKSGFIELSIVVSHIGFSGSMEYTLGFAIVKPEMGVEMYKNVANKLGCGKWL